MYLRDGQPKDQVVPSGSFSLQGFPINQHLIDHHDLLVIVVRPLGKCCQQQMGTQEKHASIVDGISLLLWPNWLQTVTISRLQDPTISQQAIYRALEI